MTESEIQEIISKCQECKGELGGMYSEKFVNNASVGFICWDCQIERRLNDFIKDDYVNTALLLDASLGIYEPRGTKLANRKRLTRCPFTSELHRLTNLQLKHYLSQLTIKTLEFQGKVWFDAELGKFVNNLPYRSCSGIFRSWSGYEEDPTYDGFEMAIRYTSMAGRAMITFEATAQGDPKNDEPIPVETQITFITEEGSNRHRMGWQSCEGKSEAIISLCNMAIFSWGGRLGKPMNWSEKLSRDDKVSIF